VTFDLKFPYHGKHPPTGRGTNIPSAVYCDHDHIEIGNGDLSIDGNLMLCTSQLEGCYGLGFVRESIAASAILAGSENFEIDELEAWVVVSTN
jgi:hypothetical protein